MTNTPCHCCDGSGVEVDQARLGGELRSLRERSNIGLREMALQLYISHSHLSCLESGKRRWGKALKTRYLSICGYA